MRVLLSQVKKSALIFGVTGQDGSYLAELLISKGYVVHGVRRRSSSFNTGRIDHLIANTEIWEKKFFLHYGDLEDSNIISHLINRVKPEEIYNLAAQSHVGLSFEEPIYTVEIAGLATLKILECIRQSHLQIKFYQASTSELFGGEGDSAFDESSPLSPKSPYAAGKLLGFWMTKIYREAYGIFAVNGILFNHESPRRGETFVTRKITRGLARIKNGLQQELTLGNIYASRDWGHARDYVEAMWLMLQAEEPRDLVISSDTNVTVKDFIEIVAKELSIELVWKGSGVEEVAIDKATGKVIIRINPEFLRPLEVSYLEGNSAQAREYLGWKPQINLEQLAREMVEEDLQLCNKEIQYPGTHRI